MRSPRQGEIWWAEAEDRRRPVLIVTRDEAIPVLNRVIVAPVTRTIRGIATEVPLGPADGLREECVASFDNVQPIGIACLSERVSGGERGRRAAICAALRALAGC